MWENDVVMENCMIMMKLGDGGVQCTPMTRYECIIEPGTIIPSGSGKSSETPIKIIAQILSTRDN